MKYIIALFMLASGYYTFTYGISVWKNEKNKLGGFAGMMLAIIGTGVPLIVLFIKA